MFPPEPNQNHQVRIISRIFYMHVPYPSTFPIIYLIQFILYSSSKPVFDAIKCFVLIEYRNNCIRQFAVLIESAGSELAVDANRNTYRRIESIILCVCIWKGTRSALSQLNTPCVTVGQSFQIGSTAAPLQTP